MRFAPCLFALLLTAAPVAASAAPAIWEVSDAASKVWLFGSVHVLPKDMAWRTPRLDDLLKQTEQIYFEADIGPLGQLAVAISGIKMGFGDKIDWVETLTPEQKDKLAAAITPLGLSTELLVALLPWLSDAMIQVTVIYHLGYSPSSCVDSTLQAELPKERKAYFETVAGQLALLAADPIDNQNKQQKTTVDT